MPPKVVELRQKRSLPGRPPASAHAATSNRTATVGLELLQAIARMDGPATLTEIAHALDMSVTTTSRYIASLAAAEFLHQDQNTGKYDLGPAAIELGATAMSRIDAVRIGTDLMRGLTQATQLVSILAVWGTNGPTMIRWEQAHHDLPIRIREGRSLSLVTTAIGRVFLTYHDESAVKPVLARDLKLWNGTAAAAARFDGPKIEAMRDETRREGAAYAAGLNNPMLAALAAPIFGPDGRLLLGLGIAGIVGTFDTGYGGEAASLLKQTAARLTRMLGGGTSREA